MEKQENKKKLTKYQYLLLYFLIYAFLGWIMETAYAFYIHGIFVKRGFLLGPLCPIYGYGAIIIITILTNYKNNSFKLFVIAAVVFSLFEYIAGYALDAIFAEKWWDYTDQYFNLNGRITIFFSFTWGIISILFINHIHPFIKKHTKRVLNRIPYLLQNTLLKSATIILIADTFFSSLKYLIK